MSDDHRPLLELHRPEDVGAGFEARVFAKIGRVKRRRRVAAIAAAPLAVIALVVALQFVSAPASAPQPLTARQNAPAVKEEVPVSADVYFASSDGRTQYPVERVSYTAAQPPAGNARVRQEL